LGRLRLLAHLIPRFAAHALATTDAISHTRVEFGFPSDATRAAARPRRVARVFGRRRVGHSNVARFFVEKFQKALDVLDDASTTRVRAI
jgi:hypothetical protein